MYPKTVPQKWTFDVVFVLRSGSNYVLWQKFNRFTLKKDKKCSEITVVNINYVSVRET